MLIMTMHCEPKTTTDMIVKERCLRVGFILGLVHH